MYLKNNSSSFRACLSTIIRLIILHSLPLLSSTNNNVDQHYEDCAPTKSSCGFAWEIAYPFWEDGQPDYCGHPGFKLGCVDNNSTLTINIENQPHHILGIHYEAKVLRIVKPQSFTDSYCPETENLLSNTTLDLDLFSLASSSQNATLFYNCTYQDFVEDLEVILFTCKFGDYTFTSDDSLDGYLVVNNTEKQMVRETCSIEVFTFVLKSAVIENSFAENVLSEGFELKWKVDEDGQCEDCVKSGGRCGFYRTLNQQICFCKDGPHDKSCGTKDVLVSTDLPPSTAGKSKTRSRQIFIIVTIVSIIGIAIVMAGIMYCLWRQTGPIYGDRVTSKKALQCNTIETNGSEAKLEDLPLLEFEQLALATNNFHDINKIGQGGFGPVYKGKLENETEIAVKRLSQASGQGQQEFMNEVLVISKLQHKNLVKLLGCCVKGEEKLLVYEFMPNKSLDALLFVDPVQRKQLGWKLRFDIIKGICRGMLYLHRDSRLKIIHRDLKPSNILLDEELNPKISDFGMARIFGGKQHQANTLRVVGTYGYMSPEYAMDGQFSEKSDVFSLGVLLFEIVCGRRNAIVDDDSMNLISYAWKLWNENDMLSLIDPTISDPCFQAEIIRSLHVGLLCVQELPQDRPSISTVISMLDYVVIDLPHPLQPIFTQGRYFSETTIDVHQQYQQNCSLNHVSITSVHGR